MQWLTKDDWFQAKINSQSPNMLSFLVLHLLVHHPGPTGGLTALCRSLADFFMSLAWEKAFSLLQTQFGTQKRWYDKVIGKNPDWGGCGYKWLWPPWSQGEWMNEWMNWADFLHVDANSGTLDIVRYGCDLLGHGTL